MRRNTSPIGLEHLSAYLDGELDEARCAAVERHLADHPEATARVAEYCRRDQALRLAFAEFGIDQARRPIPRVRQPSSSGERRIRLAVAVAMLGMILGPVGWWYASMNAEDQALATLAREAVAAHLLYASPAGRSPLVAEARENLSVRLSALLGAEVEAPDLSQLGLRLVALRGLPAGGGLAALLVYQDADGHDVSCYFKRLADNRETDFARKAAAGANVVYRLDEHLGYAVVGARSVSALQKIAEVGYREISSKGR